MCKFVSFSAVSLFFASFSFSFLCTSYRDFASLWSRGGDQLHQDRGLGGHGPPRDPRGVVVLERESHSLLTRRIQVFKVLLVRREGFTPLCDSGGMELGGERT